MVQVRHCYKVLSIKSHANDQLLGSILHKVLRCSGSCYSGPQLFKELDSREKRSCTRAKALGLHCTSANHSDGFKWTNGCGAQAFCQYTSKSSLSWNLTSFSTIQFLYLSIWHQDYWMFMYEKTFVISQDTLSIPGYEFYERYRLYPRKNLAHYIQLTWSKEISDMQCFFHYSFQSTHLWGYHSKWHKIRNHRNGIFIHCSPTSSSTSLQLHFKDYVIIFIPEWILFCPLCSRVCTFIETTLICNANLFFYKHHAHGLFL